MSNQTGSSRDQQQKSAPPAPKRTTQQQDSVENEPAVDRGERIATGKNIARGGHESGNVAGADAQPPDDSDA